MPSICASFFVLPDVGFHIRRTCPHRFDRRADRERFTVAVGDLAAVRADLDHAAVARIAFFLQKVIVYPLQIHAAAEQPGQPGQQQRKQHSWRAIPAISP